MLRARADPPSAQTYFGGVTSCTTEVLSLVAMTEGSRFFSIFPSDGIDRAGWTPSSFVGPRERNPATLICNVVGERTDLGLARLPEYSMSRSQVIRTHGYMAGAHRDRG